MIIKTPKKLIEVALPLDDINEATAREKTIRHGHPSSLHMWWARRPLAAARAIIFAQMVNDPGYERSLGRGVNKKQAQHERERLFNIIRRLVLWENTNNEEVLQEANDEIRKSWRETCELNRGHPDASSLFNPEKPPGLHDPFAGGGAIPLEAQRLGLDSYASDLNPVAVMINKAMIDIPPKFAKRSPIGPIPTGERQQAFPQDWPGCSGLAEDIRRYGYWIKEQAESRLASIYPTVAVTVEHANTRPELKPYVGQKLKVMAWIWARTVKSPSPAHADCYTPLMKSYRLAKRDGKEAILVPKIEQGSKRVLFEISSTDVGDDDGGTVGRTGAICLFSGAPIPLKDIRDQGKKGLLGDQLVAVVAEGKGRRIYLPANYEQESVAKAADPGEYPNAEIEHWSGCTNSVVYGLDTFGKLFTKRQAATLVAFSDLIAEASTKAHADALRSGLTEGDELNAGGSGAKAYSQAIAVYLSFALDKMADLGNNLVRWEPIAQCPRQLFGKQAIPMVWDYAEANPLCSSSGSWEVFVDGISKAFSKSFDNASNVKSGCVSQADAQTQSISAMKVVSTDPPYYDNVPYSNLSDFFYIWMRRNLRSIYPEIFSTKVVPRSEELVATASRHGGKEEAEKYFVDGMTLAMRNLAQKAHPCFPVTIYYAFKQSETSDGGTVSKGWETFIESVIRADFSIVGTWPIRTENASRMRGQGSNALASSIVLVCQKRSAEASNISRKEFLRELKDELAEAVDAMIGGAEGVSPVAPVDLAQAVIGPGMAIFSKYSAVLEADGSPMSVHTALTLINRMLTEGADDFDADTQFCLGWFDEQGWAAGEFGKADVLTRAKGTSVDHVKSAGVVEASGGKVRLLKPAEYPSDWTPENDNNTPVWEALHQMIRELRAAGETASGGLLAGMPQRAEPIRNLAYRLYTLCERKGWAEDARAYNELITSWASIEAASHEKGHFGSQANLEI